MHRDKLGLAAALAVDALANGLGIEGATSTLNHNARRALARSLATCPIAVLRHDELRRCVPRREPKPPHG